MTTYTDRIRTRRKRAGSARKSRPLWFVLLLCAALLSGLFVAVILVAGSRDLRIVAAVLVLISTVLFVGYLVVRERFWERALKHERIKVLRRALQQLGVDSEPQWPSDGASQSTTRTEP